MPETGKSKHNTKQTSLLENLLSTGLVDHPKKIPYLNDEPKISGYVCFPNPRLSDKDFFVEDFGQGYDLSETLAKVKSIAECLERFCLFNPARSSLHNNPPRQKIVSPSTFRAYSAEQIDIQEFDRTVDTENYFWSKVLDLFTGGVKFVPSQLIYLSSLFDQEFPIRRERISTGAAFGQVKNKDFALRKGFLEVIERDACIFTYLTNRKIRKIRNLPQELSDLVDYIERYRLEVHLFDLFSDLEIPTVMCITLDRTGIGDAVNIGSKADLNYFNAIRGAILESIQSRRGSRIRYPQAPSNPDLSKISTVEERHLSCRSLDRISELNNLVNTDLSIDYNDLVTRTITLPRAFANLSKRGYHVFVADMTLPQLKRRGFEVLKVLIPELHPLYLSEDAKSLYSVHYGEIKGNPNLKPHMLT